jgi:hypothetical protein
MALNTHGGRFSREVDAVLNEELFAGMDFDELAFPSFAPEFFGYGEHFSCGCLLHDIGLLESKGIFLEAHVRQVVAIYIDDEIIHEDVGYGEEVFHHGHVRAGEGHQQVLQVAELSEVCIIAKELSRETLPPAAVRQGYVYARATDILQAGWDFRAVFEIGSSEDQACSGGRRMQRDVHGATVHNAHSAEGNAAGYGALAGGAII